MSHAPDVHDDRWRILDGPATMQYPLGEDWELCWVWLTGRGEEKRHVAVYVARGCLGSYELADESKRAMQTRGESAVAAVLDEAEPPTRLVITRYGIGRV
jgi:hypothetical protein